MMLAAALVLIALLFLVVAPLALWKGPGRLVRSIEPAPTALQRVQLENELRKTIAQIFGGVGILVTLFLGWEQIRATREELSTTKEGQVTDRLSKAVEHLGDSSLAVRVGGVYALERIAKDSPRDYWTVLEVLTAFIRGRAAAPQIRFKRNGVCAQPSSWPPRPRHPERNSDVQAVLTVIKRRDWERDRGRLDLRGVQLSDVDFAEAHLERADFDGSLLRNVDFYSAYLRSCRSCIRTKST